MKNQDALFENEYYLPSIIRGNVRIDWVNLDEGFDGDYDPENPDDVNLLRFDVSMFKNGEWVEVPDGSYCTQVPAKTDKGTLSRILVSFMNEIYDDVVSVGKAKRTCERLSWTAPDSNIAINPMDNVFN